MARRSSRRLSKADAEGDAADHSTDAAGDVQHEAPDAKVRKFLNSEDVSSLRGMAIAQRNLLKTALTAKARTIESELKVTDAPSAKPVIPAQSKVKSDEDTNPPISDTKLAKESDGTEASPATVVVTNESSKSQEQVEEVIKPPTSADGNNSKPISSKGNNELNNTSSPVATDQDATLQHSVATNDKSNGETVKPESSQTQSDAMDATQTTPTTVSPTISVPSATVVAEDVSKKNSSLATVVSAEENPTTSKLVDSEQVEFKLPVTVPKVNDASTETVSSIEHVTPKEAKEDVPKATTTVKKTASDNPSTVSAPTKKTSNSLKAKESQGASTTSSTKENKTKSPAKKWNDVQRSASGKTKKTNVLKVSTKVNKQKKSAPATKKMSTRRLNVLQKLVFHRHQTATRLENIRRRKVLVEHEQQREPLRTKSHWDGLLDEMVWMATDFMEERKFKVTAAKAAAQMVERHVLLQLQSKLQVKEKHDESKKAVSRIIANAIKQFWKQDYDGVKGTTRLCGTNRSKNSDRYVATERSYEIADGTTWNPSSVAISVTKPVTQKDFGGSVLSDTKLTKVEATSELCDIVPTEIQERLEYHDSCVVLKHKQHAVAEHFVVGKSNLDAELGPWRSISAGIALTKVSNEEMMQEGSDVKSEQDPDWLPGDPLDCVFEEDLDDVENESTVAEQDRCSQEIDAALDHGLCSEVLFLNEEAKETLETIDDESSNNDSEQEDDAAVEMEVDDDECELEQESSLLEELTAVDDSSRMDITKSIENKLQVLTSCLDVSAEVLLPDWALDGERVSDVVCPPYFYQVGVSPSWISPRELSATRWILHGAAQDANIIVPKLHGCDQCTTVFAYIAQDAVNQVRSEMELTTSWLIIVPEAQKTSWHIASSKYVPGLRTVILDSGTDFSCDDQIAIVSYSDALTLRAQLRRFQWPTVIFVNPEVQTELSGENLHRVLCMRRSRSVAMLSSDSSLKTQSSEKQCTLLALLCPSFFNTNDECTEWLSSGAKHRTLALSFLETCCLPVHKLVEDQKYHPIQFQEEIVKCPDTWMETLALRKFESTNVCKKELKLRHQLGQHISLVREPKMKSPFVMPVVASSIVVPKLISVEPRNLIARVNFSLIQKLNLDVVFKTTWLSAAESQQLATLCVRREEMIRYFERKSRPAELDEGIDATEHSTRDWSKLVAAIYLSWFKVTPVCGPDIRALVAVEDVSVSMGVRDDDVSKSLLPSTSSPPFEVMPRYTRHVIECVREYCDKRVDLLTKLVPIVVPHAMAIVPRFDHANRFRDDSVTEIKVKLVEELSSQSFNELVDLAVPRRLLELPSRTTLGMSGKFDSLLKLLNAWSQCDRTKVVGSVTVPQPNTRILIVSHIPKLLDLLQVFLSLRGHYSVRLQPSVEQHEEHLNLWRFGTTEFGPTTLVGLCLASELPELAALGLGMQDTLACTTHFVVFDSASHAFDSDVVHDSKVVNTFLVQLMESKMETRSVRLRDSVLPNLDDKPDPFLVCHLVSQSEPSADIQLLNRKSATEYLETMSLFLVQDQILNTLEDCKSIALDVDIVLDPSNWDQADSPDAQLNDIIATNATPSQTLNVTELQDRVCEDTQGVEELQLEVEAVRHQFVMHNSTIVASSNVTQEPETSNDTEDVVKQKRILAKQRALHTPKFVVNEHSSLDEVTSELNKLNNAKYLETYYLIDSNVGQEQGYRAELFRLVCQGISHSVGVMGPPDPAVDDILISIPSWSSVVHDMNDESWSEPVTTGFGIGAPNFMVSFYRPNDRDGEGYSILYQDFAAEYSTTTDSALQELINGTSAARGKQNKGKKRKKTATSLDDLADPSTNGVPRKKRSASINTAGENEDDGQKSDSEVVDWGIGVPKKVSSRKVRANNKKGTTEEMSDVLGEAGDSWTPWEDAAILKAVDRFGPNWELAANLLNSNLRSHTVRSGQQLLARYHIISRNVDGSNNSVHAGDDSVDGMQNNDPRKLSSEEIGPWATPALHKKDLLWVPHIERHETSSGQNRTWYRRTILSWDTDRTKLNPLVKLGKVRDGNRVLWGKGQRGISSIAKSRREREAVERAKSRSISSHYPDNLLGYPRRLLTPQVLEQRQIAFKSHQILLDRLPVDTNSGPNGQQLVGHGISRQKSMLDQEQKRRVTIMSYNNRQKLISYNYRRNAAAAMQAQEAQVRAAQAQALAQSSVSNGKGKNTGKGTPRSSSVASQGTKSKSKKSVSSKSSKPNTPTGTSRASSMNQQQGAMSGLSSGGYGAGQQQQRVGGSTGRSPKAASGMNNRGTSAKSPSGRSLGGNMSVAQQQQLRQQQIQQQQVQLKQQQLRQAQIQQLRQQQQLKSRQQQSNRGGASPANLPVSASPRGGAPTSMVAQPALFSAVNRRGGMNTGATQGPSGKVSGTSSNPQLQQGLRPGLNKPSPMSVNRPMYQQGSVTQNVPKPGFTSQQQQQVPQGNVQQQNKDQNSTQKQ